MPDRIGLVANQSDVPSTLQLIERADALGIRAAWLIMASASPDSLATFAAAATRTQQIRFGTAIATIWPRHPLVLAQQAMVIHALAPGRLRIGVGPGGAGITRIYGIAYERPLAHVREYINILKTLFTQGEVAFDGRYYHAHARLGQTLAVPVLASALQRGSFELCGQIADGALTWVCPIAYLREVAIPALTHGAQQAGRATPPLIAHVPVAVHDNADEVRQAARAQLAIYPRLPHYQQMFTAAGFPEASDGQWSERMIEALVVHGDEQSVKQQLASICAAGITEIMAHPILAGADPASSLTRTLETLANSAHELP
jgi:F420-dependent oxidoreductase-like protein